MSQQQEKIREKIQAFKLKHPQAVIRCPVCNIAMQSIHLNKGGKWKCPKCHTLTPYAAIKPTKKDLTKGGGSRRRKLSDTQIILHEQMAALLANKMPQGMDNYTLPSKTARMIYRQIALASLLYLSGRRISEVIGVKDDGGAYVVQPLMRNQIKIESQEDGTKIMKIDNMVILKTRAKMIKVDESSKLIKNHPHLSIKLLYDYDKSIMPYLERYLQMNDSLHQDSNYVLFNMCRRTAWRYIYDLFDKKYYCHWLRHSRLNNLTQDFNFNELQLRQFAGWTTTRMAQQYVHLNEDILLDSMKQRYKAKN